MTSGLHNIDCIEYMRHMSPVTMVLTDIPYGVVSRPTGGIHDMQKGDADRVTFDLGRFLDLLLPKVLGSVYIFCATEQVSQIRSRMAEEMTTRLCVWEKTNPCPMNGQHLWLSGIELCVFGRRKKATFNEHCKNTVWRYPIVRRKWHPTEKPLKLFRYLIEVSSNPGDTVFDPCAGSGTTGVAAKQLDRKFIGCELNPEYWAKALERISER